MPEEAGQPSNGDDHVGSSVEEGKSRDQPSPFDILPFASITKAIPKPYESGPMNRGSAPDIQRERYSFTMTKGLFQGGVDLKRTGHRRQPTRGAQHPAQTREQGKGETEMQKEKRCCRKIKHI